MASDRRWRSIGAWAVVGAQFGLAAGVVVWLIAVRLGLYDDRRVGWVLVGVPAMVGALVSPTMVRSRWVRSWWSPAQVTAMSLPVVALVMWLAGALAGEGPDYNAPSIEAAQVAAAIMVTSVLVLVVLVTVRWQDHAAVRLGSWTLGVAVMVCSVPWIVFALGIPTFTWGRALTIASGLAPFRLLRRGRKVPDPLGQTAP